MGENSFDIDDKLLLIRVICHQDRRALADLYLKYRRRIKSYITSNINSSADIEDLTQEVFIQLCAGTGRYDGHSDEKSYLLGIAKNTIHRHHRRKSKIKVSETVFIHSVSTKSSGDEIYQRFEKISEDAIIQLHPKERQAFRLRFIKGLSPKEAAK